MEFTIETDDKLNELMKYIDSSFESYMSGNKVDIIEYSIESNNFRGFSITDPNCIPAVLLTIQLGLECNIDIVEILSLFFSNFAKENNKSIEIDQKNKKIKIQGYNGEDAVNIIKELKK